MYLYIKLAKEQLCENVSTPKLDYTSLSQLLSWTEPLQPSQTQLMCSGSGGSRLPRLFVPVCSCSCSLPQLCLLSIQIKWLLLPWGQGGGSRWGMEPHTYLAPRAFHGLFWCLLSKAWELGSISKRCPGLLPMAGAALFPVSHLRSVLAVRAETSDTNLAHQGKVQCRWFKVGGFARK